jgi:hypothetical protein
MIPPFRLKTEPSQKGIKPLLPILKSIIMKKSLAIHLIREQIRNQVLILTLENLGFDCTCYTMNISEVILSLVGFEDKTDQLYQRYFELIEKAVEETDYRNMDEKLKEWPEIIYSEMQSLYFNIH